MAEATLASVSSHLKVTATGVPLCGDETVVGEFMNIKVMSVDV